MTMTAEQAIAELAHAVNRGGGQREVAEAFAHEHGYLGNQIAYGIALGVIGKCRFALHSDGTVSRCGDVMMPLALGRNPERGTDEWTEEQEARMDHPYHDGEFTCNAVRGALVTLLGNDARTSVWRFETCWIWR